MVSSARARWLWQLCAEPQLLCPVLRGLGCWGRGDSILQPPPCPAFRRWFQSGSWLHTALWVQESQPSFQKPGDRARDTPVTPGPTPKLPKGHLGV